ncbi:MAG: hypothetical protein KF745_03845 [Phycisphaeraceae bacterium]|nr:hypothetical protein [Phycisphaeraceae bacterium]
MQWKLRRRGVEAAWVAVVAIGGVGAALAYNPVPTTLQDFFLKGSQPGSLIDGMQQGADNCSICHAGYNEQVEPYTRWSASMMAQASRDPITHACLTISNQDAAFAGELCLRCHAPLAWIEGRSEPPDMSGLGGQYDPENMVYEFPGDFEGVSCHLCHRMVDPANSPGAPARDIEELAALNVPPNGIPINPSSANYVIDRFDVRRGPFDLSEFWGPNFTFHYWERSPFHLSSSLCATCHDVSNPVYTRQIDGSYALNPLNQAHATQDKYDMFPVERTYSEWSQSLFAQGPVNTGVYPSNGAQPRFGGSIGPAVSSCQDCHMPRTSGQVCLPGFGPPERPVIGQHNFNGANSWVLRAINYLYPPSETNLTPQRVDEAIARNIDMLQRASDLELSVIGTGLRARVVNMTGHKLPTGYHEGRRMWVNVKFYNANNQLIAERGAYNPETAVLSHSDTKVYEATMGLDAAAAAATGLPEGEGFHFAVNNKIFFDNRIPPMGFTNAGFASVQARPVGYGYADGQYWDDTSYPIPPLAASAIVSVYHQTTTKEYIEFLRDANVTNADGQVAYTMWEQFGKSAPVLMDTGSIVTGRCAADWDGNGVIEPTDIAIFINTWFTDLGNATTFADFDLDGVITPSDIAGFINKWFNGVNGNCN